MRSLGPREAVAAGRPASTRLSPLGRRFWYLWTASTVSSTGDGLNYVALPLLAATLTRRPFLVAAVLFVERLPWLVVAVPAGAYADRAHRPALMRSMDLVRAALLAAVATLVATGQMTIALVYACALAVGICDTFFAGSAQAVLPAVVDAPSLPRANGLLSVGATAGEQTFGPAVGGVLFSVSTAAPFAADAVSFLGSAGLLLGLGRSHHRRSQRGVEDGGHRLDRRNRRRRRAAVIKGLWDDTKAGAAWYRRSTVLCVVTGTVAGLAFCQAMVSGILVLFVLERLHLDQVGYGLFMAAVAVGNVAGGLVAARLLARLGTATVVVLATTLAAISYLAAGATSSPYLAAGLLGLEAIAVVVGNVATVSFRQRVTPLEMQARVANIWRGVVWGAIPFGALAGGALGTAFDLRVPFFVAGGFQVLLALLVGRPLHRLMASQGEGRSPANHR